MLTRQKTDRENLRMQHRLILVKEVQRRGLEGCDDPGILAERLRTNTSIISAHIAQQRAEYINLID